jgi:inner membrane protein
MALGATIAEAGFRKRLGGKAVVIGAVGGLLPDLDIVLGIGDPWATLVHHRGSSHSLLVLPLVALALGAAGWLWARREHAYRTWLHLALWALLTHPLLDACTTWGTQLFAPFSDARFALDAVAIVDPLYSIPLFLAVALAIRRRGRAFSRHAARAVLSVTTLYLAFGWVQAQQQIERASEQLLAEGFHPIRIRATPTLLNDVVFRIVARDAGGRFRVGYASSSERGPIVFAPVEADDDPLVAAACESERGQLLEWFAMGMLHAERAHTPGPPSVVLVDERYGSVAHPEASPYGWRALFDETGRLLDFERMPNERDLGQEIGALATRGCAPR